MALSTWLLYLVVSVVTALTPGPAVLLAVSNSVSLGARRVLFSSLGNICGLGVVSTVAILGLGTLLKTSALLFLILKTIGAAYLIWMGIRQWRSPVNPFQKEMTRSEEPRITRRGLFLRSIFIALTNPKSILFFTALFPQFISVKAPLGPQFLILTGTMMTCSFCALMGYALLARSVKSWFASPRRARGFNRVTGSLFIALGIGVSRLRPAT